MPNSKRVPTLAELEEAERDLRETAERQITNLEEEAHFITLDELDKLDADERLDAINYEAIEIIQLAKNVEADVIDWAKSLRALVKARAKTTEKKAA
jgi:hypothetical protein